LVIDNWKYKHKPKHDERDFVLYSFRHSAILFALEYGNIDVFKIAKNSSKGVLMREREKWEEQRRDYIESGDVSVTESTHKNWDGFRYKQK
jgi:hypothetical protein